MTALSKNKQAFTGISSVEYYPAQSKAFSDMFWVVFEKTGGSHFSASELECLGVDIEALKELAST